MKSLVVVEHEGGRIRLASRAAIGFVRALEGAPTALVIGHDADAAAADAARYMPTSLADHALLRHPIADRFARVIAEVVAHEEVELVVAASTTFAKDILARAAGLLGGAMVSDVVAHELRDGALLFRKPMYAGNAIATVKLNGTPRIVTVRPSAYAPAAPGERVHEVHRLKLDTARLASGVTFECTSSRPATRPDLTEARVVVSGGRAIKSVEEFESLVGALADRLGGAAGCTRALVDAGIAPNDLQVGQTGKIVAPDLYIALGLSGAVQHTAGMKNAKVVVAINSDAQAPIFELANFGLVADVREVVPRLIAELAK